MKLPVHMVAGENILYAKEAFDGLGTLTFRPDRAIRSADLKDTNVLLIRSVTRVDEALLHGTAVEFVGSASAGTDHLDEAYLRAKHIALATASGSNANSVAEYVMAALLILSGRQGFSLSGKTIGIVGVGNIGKLVKTKAEALGMHPVLNDPPLAKQGMVDHRPLKEALSCDVVTLHTPLTTGGPYPTYHLLNERTFKWLKPAAVFINAARGEVVETHALLEAITRRRIGPTVIDVWEHEPHINWDLFQSVTLGTPHIAGHSLDAKANGTLMVYSALCRYLGIDRRWDPVHSLPLPMVPSLEIDDFRKSDEDIVREAVAALYSLQADHQHMQHLLNHPSEARPAEFDRLRKHYPVRREFHRTRIILPKERKRLREIFSGLGFAEISQDG
jgi:erythronate-4-phosphate dehydrogenase